MYKILNFKDFFNDEKQKSLDITERKIALSLITPNQIVNALPGDEMTKFHLNLSLEIICDIYQIPKPKSSGYQAYYYQLITVVNKYIKNDDQNFVIVRYVLLRNYRLAIIEYPLYITEYEHVCIQQLAKIYTEYGIETQAVIHQYDPIDCCQLHSRSKSFKSDGKKSALDYSLEYFDESKSIINYNLQAPKEYILKGK